MGSVTSVGKIQMNQSKDIYLKLGTCWLLREPTRFFSSTSMAKSGCPSLGRFRLGLGGVSSKRWIDPRFLTCMFQIGEIRLKSGIWEETKMKTKKRQTSNPANLSASVPYYFRKLKVDPDFRKSEENRVQRELESMREAILLAWGRGVHDEHS